MEQNKKKNTNKNNQNSSKSAPNAGFFQLTKSQISQGISKYESAISTNNTVFQAKLPEQKNNKPIVFKKRLNSLDSTILEDASYNVLDNKELKLEKRMETVKNHILEIDEKIIVAQTVRDVAALEELNLQRRIMVANLKTLMVEYENQNSGPTFFSVLAKIYEAPKNIRKHLWKSFMHFLRTSPIMKHFKPLTRSFMMRDTIVKLNKINKSVDELVKMQIPFGEQDARYATLVSQLSSAGALHSQILKEFESY